jgi:hypothetical protein
LQGFAGYVVGDAPGSKPLEHGGPWPDVDVALRWARKRAPQVVLRYGLDDRSIFSAGTEAYDGEDGPLPSWPPSPAERQAIEKEVAALADLWRRDRAAVSRPLDGISEPEIRAD